MGKVDVKQAAKLLLQNEAVAIPTETVYGLAGCIDSEAALKIIFALKKRPFFDPLIVHVLDAGQARSLVSEWPEIYDVLVAKFWPGPLTLIAPKVASVSSLITSGLDTVAIRSPQHPQALEILRLVGRPLAAPSANLFGHTSPTQASDVEHEFANAVSVVDGGPCAIGIESTVVQAERLPDQKWRLKILRPGAISRPEIEQACKSAGVAVEVVRAHSSATPGHTKSHYQPRSPLVILKNEVWSPGIQLEIVKRLGRPVFTSVEIPLPETPQMAARTLYQEMRSRSRDENHFLWVTHLPQHSGPDWEAVWDRLNRAAVLVFP